MAISSPRSGWVAVHGVAVGCCGRRKRRPGRRRKTRHRPPEKNGHGLNGYRPTDKEPFMNERQREYFRAKLLIWKDEILQRSARHAAAPAGREPESSRSRRPRVLRDRPRDRAARARPPAQADRQDRRRDAAHRRRHLRLLRGDRRADLAEAPRGASDRDACRSRRRSATSAASGSIGTTEFAVDTLNFARRPGLFPAVFVSCADAKYTRPPAGRAGGRVGTPFTVHRDAAGS